ncbi:MAG TPA: M13 family metallopeptidase [Candidatus Angelobacter sp.]|jgi:predicted metalloendopeptidase|nr:M13 family metallopeptidase [Candidatus Angelobacter sp.]
MFWKRVFVFIFASLIVASAQTSAPKAPAGKKTSRTSRTSAKAALPGSNAVKAPKSFDLDAIDKSVDPCEDFYEYACGNWRKKNPIPSDQARWGRFNELNEYNRQTLHQILEKASARSAKRSPIMQKIGDFYASCMDEKTVDSKGSAPLKPLLDRIASISNKDQFIETLAALQSQGIPALFGFTSQPDLHNASVEIANVSQGGLTLPDREYYVSSEAKFQETRDKYRDHVAKMFTLLGDEPAEAQKEAQTVLDIETKLANSTMERVKMRNPSNRDHKMPVSELSASAPNFEFSRYFQSRGAPAFSEVNVAPPDFFKQVNETLASVPLDDWKAYLRWHAVNSVAPLLSSSFVDEDFNFNSRYLNGIKEQQPRWKRCVQRTDQSLGEALGQPYVAATFGAAGKQRMLNMVMKLEAALADDIQNLEWMTPETRKQAEVKLRAISNKIGYPDKWKNYATVKVVRGDLLGNALRARVFEVKRNMSKIGKPLDKKEWNMTPPTVNAYYSPPENDINFPAGILQPPFFDRTQDDAVNFGGIGVVIGHELTHGFDDQGSKYDSKGNLSNWWTEKDREEFEKRTGCTADEYSSFVAVDDVHLNGKLTLGENTADNGGVHIALMALRKAMAADARNTAKQTKNGFSPEQRFFLGFAQIWCENFTPESARLQALTNPHSPGQYRTNGSLQNSEEFAKAFGCKAGQKMVSPNACRVW